MAKSLDQIDFESFRPGPSPLEGSFTPVTPGTPPAQPGEGPSVLPLGGSWQLAPEGSAAGRLGKPWPDAVPAAVPGSVHSALFAAGLLPDPTVEANQRLARQQSYRGWWYRTEFARPGWQGETLLHFAGVCNRCEVYLNGTLLGGHEGMFGGPEFEVGHLLQDSNRLEVYLAPVPFVPSTPGDPSPDVDNKSYVDTVVFSCCYGWHYSNLPSLGIWQAVTLREKPRAALRPLLYTRSHETGEVGLVLEPGRIGSLPSPARLLVELCPDNFAGSACGFEVDVDATRRAGFAFRVPDFHLWWPVDLGKPDLYRVTLTLVDEQGVADRQSLLFGIRSVKLAPFPGGEQEDLYNWTFVVNGEKHFIKGTGWCTADALLDFTAPRYERFVALAAAQHVQLLRAWGGGLPETDEFYDCCDRHGIMVMQEWPTAWNSHQSQPYHVLEETVRLNTLRLRNRASLVLWCAGNESSEPFGRAIDMMGRYATELDGTRPFHRGEAWGGSSHDYTCWWDRAPLSHNLRMESRFFGEFGLCCMPQQESVARYLPQADFAKPVPLDKDEFIYHNPVFGRWGEVERLDQYAGYFIAEDADFSQFILGSQLAQVVGNRYTLERARTRWPECTGALYYKLNDNFPAASWSAVDWYGAPKLGYYAMQDALAPVHTALLFQDTDFYGTPVDVPVYLLDDTGALAGQDAVAVVRVYNGALECIREQRFSVVPTGAAVQKLGVLSLGYRETRSAPLLFSVETFSGGQRLEHSFHFFNYERQPGCLFRLPQTSLVVLREAPGLYAVRNSGTLPAVGVTLTLPGRQHSLTLSDNFFWLEPGASLTVASSLDGEFEASAFNAPTASLQK